MTKLPIDVVGILQKAIIESAIYWLKELWYFWLFILLAYGIKFYFNIFLNIYTMEEFADYTISKWKLRKTKISLPEKIIFPKGFEWASETVFNFGNYGNIAFANGKNTGKQLFKILTDEKGKFVKVRVISKKLNTLDIAPKHLLNSSLGLVC